MPKFTVDEIKKALPDDITNNLFLTPLKKSDFFEAGNGGFVQFKKDCVVREALFEKKHLRDEITKIKGAEIKDAEIIAQLGKMYGESTASALISAHGQFFASMAGSLICGKIEYFGNLSLFTNMQSNSNFYQGSDGQMRAQVTTTFESHTEKSGIKGPIGPVTAEFKLVEKNGKWGYQLESIETEDLFLLKIMQSKTLVTINELRLHYNPNLKPLIEWENACKEYEENLSRIVDNFIRSNGLELKAKNLEGKLEIFENSEYYRNRQPIKGILADYKLYVENFKTPISNPKLDSEEGINNCLAILVENYKKAHQHFQQPESKGFLTKLAELAELVYNLFKLGRKKTIKTIIDQTQATNAARMASIGLTSRIKFSPALDEQRIRETRSTASSEPKAEELKTTGTSPRPGR